MNKSKRGRKPKSNIIINSSPIFDNKNDENIILKLKKPNKTKMELSIISSNTDEYEFKNHTCDCCGKNIISNIIGMPLKYNNMCFSTVYNFCNIGCIYKYINKHNINEYYEINSLVKLYKSMILKQYPLVKQIPYNRQIKNNVNVDLKYYKLQRKQKNKINFFNIDQ